MDSRRTIDDIILEVIKGLSPSDIAPDKDLVEDLGADSMQLLELALTISAEFDIDVREEEVLDLHFVRDVYEFVARRKDVA